MRGTEREREREAETQAEGEAGSLQGAGRGTRSQDSRDFSPGPKAGIKPLSHPGIPKSQVLKRDQILFPLWAGGREWREACCVHGRARGRGPCSWQVL